MRATRVLLTTKVGVRGRRERGAHVTQFSSLHAEAIAPHAVGNVIATLARQASIEINVQDAPQLAACKEFLASGTRVYVSHLPKQGWRDTVSACAAVRTAGFNPIPHIPVRLLVNAATFDNVLRDFTEKADVREVLLIAGDYPEAIGPYASVIHALREGILQKRSLLRLSIAGHPEGHPRVELDEIRRAETDKAELATALGLEVTFLTQFFFEAAPFLSWARGLREQSSHWRIIAGLSGPASLGTLFRFAVRCGVGPSIRALGARPTSLLKLASDHGPEGVMRDLAAEHHSTDACFDGLHFFCFGGFLRTCRWLHAVADQRFVLDEIGGFTTNLS